MSFPRPIGRFPSSHSLWHHQNSSDGQLTYPHCHYLSNEKLEEIQFREQCTKWIKTNVEYLMGLTGKQLALWKLHYKLDLQQHIDDRVFLAQIADQKVKTTTWKEMYQLDHSRRDRMQQMERRLQEKQDAAEARELHWEANKHKEPRPFYHWFAQVHHPPSAESAQQSSTSTILSTTPQGLLPHTITAPSTIKKRKSLESPALNSPV